ncbi:MAG: hypothetical protein ACFCU8_06480 [Thermosynechococcaceae cyanobacterium]
MSRYSLLIARINHELNNLEKTVHRAKTQVEKAERSGDADFYDAVALNLQKFYMGTERIFTEIAREIDAYSPSGSDWHKQLLQQMVLENDSVRPAVLSSETYQLLEMDYRGFRHVATHLYAFDLKTSRINELAKMLPDCLTLLRKDLQAFCQYLQGLQQNLDPLE